LGSDEQAAVSYLYGSGTTPPPPAVPAAPGSLTATAVSTNSIALKWTDNSTTETEFRVEMDGTSNGLDDFIFIGSVGANKTGATVDGLIAATFYRFRVRARNGVGNSAYSNVASATTRSACGSDPNALCLANRFSVTVTWETSDGASGQGQPQALTSDTGYFWFFGSDNVELVTKIVNGCGVPGLSNFWFFAGGLTNQRVEITVRDTLAGLTTTYVNPLGQAFLPIQDTAAFSTCSASSSSTAPAVAPAVQAAACAAEPDVLCLHNGRFQVEAFWSAGSAAGQIGKGTAVALTSETGYFWFFNSANIELVTKVLNGCAPPFHRFWVFATGLTDVEVRLRVTDTQTGSVREYVNPQGAAYAPVQDIAAFDTCP